MYTADCYDNSAEESSLGPNIDRSEVPASIQTVTALVADVYIAIALSVILRGMRTGHARWVVFTAC